MNRSHCEGAKAIETLCGMSKGEGWLLSLTIAAHRIEMIGDFLSAQLEMDGEKSLIFTGVSGLRFSYNQKLFDTQENDISTIDVMKIHDQGQPDAEGRRQISFEFSYGRLEFSFEIVEIADRANGNDPH